MKKDYMWYADKQNTPNLEVNRWLNGLFFGFTGVNFLLTYLYADLSWLEEASGVMLVLGVLFLSSAPSKALDSRREMQGLFAVVVSGIIHGMFTLGTAIWILPWMFLVYAVELLLCAAVVVAKKRRQWKQDILQRKRNRRRAENRRRRMEEKKRKKKAGA